MLERYERGEASLADLVDMALVLMESAGLKMYGRQLSETMNHAFCIAIQMRGASPAYVEKAAAWFVAWREEFPTPKEFCDRLRELEEKDRPPIQVAESPLLSPREWTPEEMEERKERLRKLLASEPARARNGGMRKVSEAIEDEGERKPRNEAQIAQLRAESQRAKESRAQSSECGPPSHESRPSSESPEEAEATKSA